MINVAVFYGGKSTEHDISVITGVQTLKNLDKSKYNVVPVYITKDNTWQIVKDADNIQSYTQNKIKSQKLSVGFF